jgi:hypothetical protein
MSAFHSLRAHTVWPCSERWRGANYLAEFNVFHHHHRWPARRRIKRNTILGTEPGVGSFCVDYRRQKWTSLDWMLPDDIQIS